MELNHGQAVFLAIRDGSRQLDGEVGLPGTRRPIEDNLSLVVKQLLDLVQDRPVDVKLPRGYLDAVNGRPREDIVLVPGRLGLGPERQAEVASKVVPFAVAPPRRPFGQTGQVLYCRVRVRSVAQRGVPSAAVPDELVQEGQQAVMGVAKRGVLGLGAPPGQLPRPADANDPVGEERLVAVLEKLTRLRGGPVGVGAAVLQPAEEGLPVLTVLPLQAHQPVVVPVEAFPVFRRQGGADRQKAAVNIRAGPRDVREPGRDPVLVVGGHDRVEGIRVSQVEHRHLPLFADGASTRPVNSFNAQGSATSACLCGSGSSFQTDENRISQVICVSRRVMPQVPGWTSPGAIACTTSAGTSGGAGIHARIALRMLTFVAAEIAPTQIMRKCTACSSAISCLASGETPASWSRSFSSYRLPGVVSGCATNARSSSSRCPLVQIAVPGVNSESPGPRTSVSQRACIA